MRDSEEGEAALRSCEGLRAHRRKALQEVSRNCRGFRGVTRSCWQPLLQSQPTLTRRRLILPGQASRSESPRGAQTLPVAEVPNLMAGDSVWIKSDLPATQSTHYLMVAAFFAGIDQPATGELVLPMQDTSPAGRRAHRRRAGRRFRRESPRGNQLDAEPASATGASSAGRSSATASRRET